VAERRQSLDFSASPPASGNITKRSWHNDLFPWEIVMLEKYYIRPATIDRLHESWITSAIEQYVIWMAERRYADRSVSRRIPILVSFGEFAKAHDMP
jgi:hypothetical protein